MTSQKDLDAKHKYYQNLPRARPAEIVVPGPGQESVWDYPRPPIVVPVEQRIKVEFNSVVIAQSQDAYRVLETAGAPVYYIPQKDIQMEHLSQTSHTSFCEWKGMAEYWAVEVNGKMVNNAAWSYPTPDPGFEQITDHLAFYAFKMDACYVGNEKAEPQPGHFYGGWVTTNIVGPIKGEPGSQRW